MIDHVISDGKAAANIYFDSCGISIISGVITIGVSHTKLNEYFDNEDNYGDGFMKQFNSNDKINFIHGGSAMTFTNSVKYVL